MSKRTVGTNIRAVITFAVVLFIIMFTFTCCKKPDNQQLNEPLPIPIPTNTIVVPPVSVVVDNSDFVIVFPKQWKVVLDDDKFKVFASHDQKKMLAYVRVTYLNSSIENELFIVDLLRQARANGTVDNYLPLAENPAWFFIESHKENIHNVQWTNLNLDKITQFSCGGVEETFDRDMCESIFSSLKLK